ncbi:hypothetical protein V5O65_24030, partial [Escherichia coli]
EESEEEGSPQNYARPDYHQPICHLFSGVPANERIRRLPRLQIGIFSMDDTTSPFMGHKIERNLFG